MRISWPIAGIMMLGLVGTTSAQDAASGKKAFLAGDYAEARRILEPLADEGDPEALYWTGIMYTRGQGYEADCREAAFRYEQAARQGHADAAFSLGFMLYRGMGASALDCELIPDREQAATWLLQAAKAGKARAQFLVGRMYESGEGFARSLDAAFEWLERAAGAGIMEAQYDLGLLYARVGNSRDAYFWFRLLEKNGYPGAAQNAARLSESLEPNAIEAADRKVQNWPPKK